MTDKHITVDSIRWHSVLPCLHLLRAAQLALRVRVLLLALLTVILFSAGRVAINSLPFVNPDGFGANFLVPDVERESVALREVARFRPLPSIVPEESMVIWNGWPSPPAPGWLGWPLETVHAPARELFRPNKSWVSLASAWTRLLWALLIWGTLGGAIIRMVAVRFARDESVPVGRAVASSARLWQSHLYGPLLPLLGIGILSLGIHTVGWLERGVGNSNGWVLLLLGWIPLILGFLMAALLILTAISWPLMVAAISTEGSDGFDGLSRAFGYVMNRPWYLLWLVALACGVGLIMTSFVWWFFDIAGWLTGSILQLPHSGTAVWGEVQAALRLAVLVSYFWSATTVIYFLLRQSDDGAPLDQVYIPGPPPKAEPLPLVGVATSQQPVIERPVTEAGEAAATQP
ncbi:MAG: hypothetical protein DWI21_18415 [Planctomycetota bacterium]|nr:MAG: hypothetical protein DWI21_18415 [Planctomycetota bacterium]GDY09242.1 hypothetical protein LBMAG52_27280 [Planctomycetia bacterium]